MRIFLTVLLFPLFTNYSSSQVQVINRSLTDSTLNYFYIGEDNALEVKWNGVNPATAGVAISDGGSTITRIDKDRYIVRVTTTTDSCHLRFYQNGNKMLVDRYYKCRYINPIVARLGDITDSIITVREILINSFVRAISPDCFYKIRFWITSFSADIIHDGETVFTTAYGSLLTQEQLKLIKTLVQGDQIYFHSMRSTGPDNRGKLLPAFRVYIK